MGVGPMREYTRVSIIILREQAVSGIRLCLQRLCHRCPVDIGSVDECGYQWIPGILWSK